MHICMHTCVFTIMHVVYRYTYTHTHTCTHTYMHTTNPHASLHIAYPIFPCHTNTHTHTHSHIHTLHSPARIPPHRIPHLPQLIFQSHQKGVAIPRTHPQTNSCWKRNLLHVTTRTPIVPRIWYAVLRASHCAECSRSGVVVAVDIPVSVTGTYVDTAVRSCAYKRVPFTCNTRIYVPV